jgi:hypothetical protein
MTRLTDEERDKLRGAAETAVNVLQRLRMERAEIDAKIARFEAVVQVYEEALGRRGRQSQDEGGSPPRRHRRGEVMTHINAVLEGGANYSEKELGQAITERFGVQYPRTTLTAALARGRGAGRWERKEKRWRMA